MLCASSTGGMPGSGASVADVAAALTVRAALAVVPGGADGREQPANIIIEIAAARNPAAAVPGLKIAGIRLERTDNSIVRRRAATRSG
jgi:hypothetical protein